MQRWEQTEGLPVHRLEHSRLGSVYAYRGELDAWWESRRQTAGDVEPAGIEVVPAPAPIPQRRAQWPLWTALGVIAFIGAGRFVARRPAELAAKTLDPVPLSTEIGRLDWPSFSPDGNQVAYSWNGPKQDHPNIYVKMIGTDSLVRLTVGPDADVVPAWSPDGREIAFLRFAKEQRNAQLLAIPAIGGRERVIAELGPGGSRPAWSPDSRWVVLGTGWETPQAIFAVNAQTGERRKLTRPAAAQADYDPAVAPDGSSLVFVRESSASTELFRQPLSPDFQPDGDLEQLTATNTWSGMPVFTADGKSIVYSSGLFEQNPGLWILQLVPSSDAPRLLLRSGERDFNPAVSRQHNRLAFVSSRNVQASTWAVDLTPDFRESGKPYPVITSTRTDYNAQYSADGKHIAFHSLRSGTSEIWTSDSDGTHARRLTYLNAPITGMPRWSPDGKWISFDSNATGHFEVYRIPSEGGTPLQLTHDGVVDGVPSWSHDGRWLYFVSNRTGTYQVWKMAIDGTKLKQITLKGGYLAEESADGRWIYYSKDHDFGPLMRAPVEGGEETEVLPAVAAFHFSVTSKGVAFVRSGKLIEFLDFATNKVSQVAKLDKWMKCGLSVSPDRRHVLFSQADESSSELMLVEGFR